MSRIRLALFTSTCVLAVWLFDFAAGRDYDLWILYALPVLLASVLAGARAGLTVVLASVTLLFVNGYLLGNPYTGSLPFVVDRVSDGLALGLIALLGAVSRGQLSRLL